MSDKQQELNRYAADILKDIVDGLESGELQVRKLDLQNQTADDFIDGKPILEYNGNRRLVLRWYDSGWDERAKALADA